MARQYTEQQKTVINDTDGNMLVSASAGTGKTTVMVERLCQLLLNGKVDISEIAVVTFTNLSASDMKRRLAEQLALYRDKPNIAEQLERLDMSAICTLHSLCVDILRNYFYVVDIDPSFSILDTVTLQSLVDKAMKEVLNSYSGAEDAVFDKLYQIFMHNRKEDNLRKYIKNVYEFSCSLPDFESWYKLVRNNFTKFGDDNKLLQFLGEDITTNLSYYRRCYELLADKLSNAGMSQYVTNVCQPNMDLLSFGKENTVRDNFDIAVRVSQSLIKNINGNTKLSKCPDVDEEVVKKYRQQLESLYKDAVGAFEPYAEIVGQGGFDNMLQEVKDSQEIIDKLVEIVLAFKDKLAELKKSYGGLDFGDLEHFTLKVLQDETSLQQLQQKYKLVFVDEYQDINAVQEAIIAKLSEGDKLFVVGDVKQSIYGFRGCDPTLFVQKQNNYQTTNSGKVVHLNDNFRSHKDILNFVNTICCVCMNERFGGVNYQVNAQLKGNSTDKGQYPAVEVCFVPKVESSKDVAQGIYDITLPTEQSKDSVDSQCDAVVSYIRQFVGSDIKIGDSVIKVTYGDIVILVRSMTDKATQLYNKLITENIPVVAGFKNKGFERKEVRDIINLLRVLDNQYNDVAFLGVCLSHFGKLTEQDITDIRCSPLSQHIDSNDNSKFVEQDSEVFTHQSDSVIGSNFVKLCELYAETYNDSISAKLKVLFLLIEDLRFYGYGTGIDGIVLRLLNKTGYNLFVQSLPNGHLRIRNLYSFINDVKGKYYAQSVDKFLRYIDESGSIESEQSALSSSAVTIMTMHGSKGLEFPVVIIPFVDSKYNYDNFDVAYNSQLGIAIKSYDFNNRTVGMSLSKYAVDLINKFKQRQEELRLLYVALTRPKNHLVIVGEYKDSYFDGINNFLPQLSNSHSSLIFNALSVSYSGLSEGDMADGVKITIFDTQQETSQVASNDSLLCEQSSDLNSVLEQLQYKYAYSDSQQLPSKVVSSALDNLRLNDIEEQPPVRTLVDDDRPKIGTAYHSVYEIVDFDSDIDGIYNTIDKLVLCGDMERRIADQLDVNLIYNTLNNKLLRKIVSSGKVYHELPFMLNVSADSVIDSPLKDNIVLQGILDMLVIDGDKAVVVDFKYTTNSYNIVERYAKQLDSYRLAVQQICGISDVECYILSIQENKLIKCE